MRRFLVAGNWKMNTVQATAVALAQDIVAGADCAGAVDLLVCPPFPYLSAVRAIVEGSSIGLGGQNLCHEPPGAFTGEVGVDMLADCGCTAIIVGHSERRHVFGETDAIINRKVAAVRARGLTAIFCVGEQLSDRESQQTELILDGQMNGGLQGVDEAALADIVIAYEPVWAIGTGKTATPDQAQAAQAHLRNWLASRYNPGLAASTRILYGGSVKPDNALTLMQQPDIDGALVGGASLKAQDFLAIAKAAATASQS